MMAHWLANIEFGKHSGKLCGDVPLFVSLKIVKSAAVPPQRKYAGANAFPKGLTKLKIWIKNVASASRG